MNIKTLTKIEDMVYQASEISNLDVDTSVGIVEEAHKSFNDECEDMTDEEYADTIRSIGSAIFRVRFMHDFRSLI